MYKNTQSLILASGSPRRQEFLTQLGLDFNVQVADIDETEKEGESAIELVTRLAREKGAAVAESNANTWIISADTIVCLAGKILGKPIDEQDAISTLMSLSGNTHKVHTAFALTHKAKHICNVHCITTEVTFAHFSEKTAKAYVDTKEPMDKAGSYGIQERGAALVEKINGSYSNVVGLPLAELIVQLERYEII